MKVQVIKQKTARQAFLDKVFPKGNLDSVVKTCDLTFAEFNKLWLKTTGKIRTGNQYDNMNTRNYLVAKNGNGEIVGNTITDEKDYGWVFHYARACGNTSKTLEVKPLDTSAKTIVRTFFSYGSELNGEHIIAKVSDCGCFVTVFKTKNHFWVR